MSSRNYKELLFEIRNELMSISRAINILRGHMRKKDSEYEVNLCNIYLSKVNTLLLKINKHLKGAK